MRKQEFPFQTNLPSPARRCSRSRTASPPAPLAIRKAPSGRRRKSRRQSHKFFKHLLRLAPQLAARPWGGSPPRPLCQKICYSDCTENCPLRPLGALRRFRNPKIGQQLGAQPTPRFRVMLEALLDAMFDPWPPFTFCCPQAIVDQDAGVSIPNLISLLPLDETPVHVHRFAARAPCDSKGSECQCGIHTAEAASALRSRKTERAAKEKPTPISQFFLAPAAPVDQDAEVSIPNISLLPLDEVPVHVRLRRPRPLRFERLRLPVWSPYSRGRLSLAKSEVRKGGEGKTDANLTIFLAPAAP